MGQVRRQNQRKVNKKHVTGQVAEIGISDFAQGELGDIVHLEFPNIGKKLKKKESACTIESVKSTADVYAPASGEITAVKQ